MSSLLLGSGLFAQEATWLGLQVTPLAIGTLDLQLERQLTPTASLHVGMGVRTQQIDRREPRVKLLSDFSNVGNTATYTSLGLRLFNPETGTDFPYVQFGLTGVWYRDQYLTLLGEQKISQGIAWGPSATIGYLIHFDKRWELDLGLQMGYSASRQDLLAYYYPGLGYSTFGPGRYGVKGGHVQPVVTLRYKIIQNKRERIREME